MYVPDQFAETREREIARIISEHPLGVLVAAGPDGLSANHIPMLAERPGAAEEPGRLIGHVALNNDLHRKVEEGAEVLAVFQAADAYISPNWYPTKAEHHRHVPTWNYQAVHVHGRIYFSKDTKTKTAVEGKLTRHFEQRSSGERAWKMADAPRDFMAAMLDSIVAFHIEVTSVIGKSKLSQNRERVDAKGVMQMLTKTGNAELAEAMDGLESSD